MFTVAILIQYFEEMHIFSISYCQEKKHKTHKNKISVLEQQKHFQSHTRCLVCTAGVDVHWDKYIMVNNRILVQYAKATTTLHVIVINTSDLYKMLYFFYKD